MIKLQSTIISSFWAVFATPEISGSVWNINVQIWSCSVVKLIWLVCYVIYLKLVQFFKSIIETNDISIVGLNITEKRVVEMNWSNWSVNQVDGIFTPKAIKIIIFRWPLKCWSRLSSMNRGCRQWPAGAEELESVMINDQRVLKNSPQSVLMPGLRDIEEVRLQCPEDRLSENMSSSKNLIT